jgi:hypothetical protein
MQQNSEKYLKIFINFFLGEVVENNGFELAPFRVVKLVPCCEPGLQLSGINFDKFGFELALYWVKLGLNWLCFLVKSAFSGEKRIKLALFCIKSL